MGLVKVTLDMNDAIFAQVQHLAAKHQISNGMVIAVALTELGTTLENIDRFPEIVGLAEAAEMCRASRTQFTNWRSRDPRFPEPLTTLKCGPIWLKPVMALYSLEKRRRNGND